MMRWKTMIAGLALTITVAAGCKQEVFLHECDNAGVAALGVPGQLECTPDFQKPVGDIPPPPTVEELNREPYYMTLAEAIAQALEHGTTGFQSTRLNLQPFGNGNFPGLANDDLVTFAGAPPLVNGSDAIRVLALDPAIIASDMETSLARFDAFSRTSMNWNAQDQPNQGLNTFQNGNFANFLTQIVKPLASGGAAGMAFTTSYQNLTRPTPGFSLTNPAYQPALVFSLDQPLLQGFGVDINQIRQFHPNSASTLQDLSRQATLYSNNGINGPPEGILITRLRFDQSRAEFERTVNFMVANVEVAYWSLYDAYLRLYTIEQGLRMAHTVWRLTKLAFDAGKIGAKDYFPQLGQYEQFRGDRLTALGAVLERERQIRALLGMPVEDGKRLVPVDAPTLAPFKPDWRSALNEALSLRPELVIAREDLKVRQFRLLRAKNDLLPDLRFNSSYGITGLGTSLGGNGTLPGGLTDNAFRSLASDHFNNWSLGLTLNVPIGYRAAYATIRQARLQLAQGYFQVRDQEDKATRFLALVYRNISEQYGTIQTRKSQRIAYGEQLKAKLQEIEVGKSLPDLQLLDALRQWTTALGQEIDGIANYNVALAGFEFGKGTLLKHDNVVISEGPLPACAQVRAVEHERQRSKAIVIRERASSPVHAACGGGANGNLAMPEILGSTAPSMAALMPSTSVEDAAPVELPAANMAAGNTWKSAVPVKSARIAPVPMVPAVSSGRVVPAPATEKPVSAPVAKPAVSPGADKQGPTTGYAIISDS